MLDVPFRSAKQLAAAIRRKQIGCLELLDLYLARVARTRRSTRSSPPTWTGPASGAGGRPRAGQGPAVGAAARRAHDHQGVLRRGGHADDVGHPPQKDNQLRRNALAVDRLLGAGVVSPASQRPHLPGGLPELQRHLRHDQQSVGPDRAPGGSSGGSAAALAAGLTGLEAGSDIGWSIRNPGLPRRVRAQPPGDRAAAWPRAPGGSRRPTSPCRPAGARGRRPPLALESWRRGRDRRRRLAAAAPPRAGRPCASTRGRDAGRSDSAVMRPCSRLQALADFLARRAKVSDRARPDIDTRSAPRYVQLLRARPPVASRPRSSREPAGVQTSRPMTRAISRKMTRANTMYHRDWLPANEARHGCAGVAEF